MSEHPTSLLERQLTVPALDYSLSDEIKLLEQGAEWTASGRSAKTLIKHPDFRIVLTVLKGRTVIKEHRAAGRISVQTVSGHIRMRIPERTVDLPAGRLLILDKDIPHEVEALEDSAFLLTMAWPEDARH